jgi:transposase
MWQMSFIRKIKKNGKIYLSEVENIWVDGKCVQKHIKYLGKEVDGKQIISLSLNDIAIKEVKVYGPLVALNEIAKQIDLEKHLGQYSKEILSMVYAHCLDYKSLNKMPDWYKRTDLNYLLNLSDVTEKKLLNAVDSIEKMDIDKIQNDIFNSVKESYNLNPKGVVYDVTNTYFRGDKCPIGAKGKSKENKRNNLLIQVGLAVTQEHGLPILHRTFRGNTHDSKTFHAMFDELKKMGIKKGLVVYDRGVTSGANINEIASLNWDTLCGLSLNDALKKIAISAKENLINLNNRTALNDNIFYSKKYDYNFEKVKGTILVCLNEKKAREIRERRFEKILLNKEVLKKGKKIDSTYEKFFNKKGEINLDEIDSVGQLDGYSILFSTKNISNSEMLKSYFDKDVIERAFKTLKGVIGLRPIRHWLENRVTAHVFICYLSYLLLSILSMKISTLKLSSAEALFELEGMYKIYLKDEKKGFEFSRTVTLSNKQKDILNCIDKKILKNFAKS